MDEKNTDADFAEACVIMAQAGQAENPLMALRILAALIEPKFMAGTEVLRKEKYLAVRDLLAKEEPLRGVETEDGVKIEASGPFTLLQAGILARKEHLIPNKLSRNLVLNSLNMMGEILTKNLFPQLPPD